MSAYEAAVEEKEHLYARIKLVREGIAQETDPARCTEQQKRLKILQAMYNESLERLDAMRPVQEKHHKAEKRRIVHADAFDFNFFERCGVAFADLEGNQARWEDIESEDNSEARARLLRALRRGRAAVSDRQREILDLYLKGIGIRQIAEQLGVDRSVVSKTLKRARLTINRIEEDLRAEERREVANWIDLSDPRTAQLVLSRLTETQSVYLYLYYGEWLDMRSIGKLLGVDHSTVCRTIHRAAGRIRELCTDSGSAELLGVDALEPALYALYRQNAVSELIPGRARDAARKAVAFGCRKRQERVPNCPALAVPIWGQKKLRVAAQSRLLCALEADAAQRFGAVFSHLRALLRSFRARLAGASLI